MNAAPFHRSGKRAPILRLLLGILMVAIAIWGESAARAQVSAEDKIFDVPRLDGVSVDTRSAELGRRGLQIDTMCCARATPWPKDTPAPSARLGWNSAGLVVEVTVHHRQPCESDYIRQLFKGDSIEFFVSPRKGSRDRYMLIISPGLDPRYPKPRHCFFADPSEEGERDLSDLAFQCACSKTADGYVMQVLLPWANLHADPQLGMELALQLYVMEADAGARPVVAMWNPAGESHLDPSSTQRIRLSTQRALPVTASAAAQDDLEHSVRTVRIVARASDAGKQFELQTPDTGVVYGTLGGRKAQSYAALSLPVGQSCQILIDGLAIPLVVVPAEDDLTTVVSQKLKCRFDACVFAGTVFPKAKLDGSQHYRVARVTYFDSHFAPAQSAKEPGRYGAVVEIADSKGKVTRRFRTLFRVPETLGRWRAGSDDLAVLPSYLAADAGVSRVVPLDASGVRDLTFLGKDDSLTNPDTAALAACMFAPYGGVPAGDDCSDFRSEDRQWWVDLKRKLNGWERQFPKPVVCPNTINGAPTPIVHQDTDEKAGVNPEALAQLDNICRGIESQVGEPISICLVRHGVVFFHHAYGQIAGRPFGIDDPGDIESATKPLGGALMMMAIGSGAVQLDESIDKIFPCLKGVPVKKEVTIRDLYDHLSGLTGDWGDQIHDTEEIIAGYYPALDVGNYSYNEVGFALGGKTIEAVSGEAYPQFARRHLLLPLGMNHTRITNGGGHNATTSLDYARFGQMLLNRGGYGDMRFLSEATFRQMLPSTDGSNRRGVGLIWMNWQKYGFSADTFGHNAGNSSVLGVDPEHDLVVVVVSAGAHKNFDGNSAPFYRAVVNSLD